jgi:hypothetical protein
MANKAELLKSCRFYDGKDDCGFPSGSEEETLWAIERLWVNKTLQKDVLFIESAVNDFLAYGLNTLERHDGIPVELKAVLFNRFSQYNERVDTAAFRDYYKRHYAKD